MNCCDIEDFMVKGTFLHLVSAVILTSGYKITPYLLSYHYTGKHTRAACCKNAPYKIVVVVIPREGLGRDPANPSLGITPAID